ncbi:hypothetical protein CLOSTASPAR_01290 [[Clostridium] asparagiforme DSM 15981]|uniref:Uncharacterized protein n=1 Tax=[Clostridium] asparagiforme DSM 15981 TaxID=518636 RepID=C0CWD6_9FIRM|nr:hypothetical protein CLOSTASPAR_01290 [[Clostridium] asparagiforme DSM 15981]
MVSFIISTFIGPVNRFFHNPHCVFPRFAKTTPYLHSPRHLLQSRKHNAYHQPGGW